MFEQLQIPTEREFENASAKLDRDEPAAEQCRLSIDTAPSPAFAAHNVSASEAALIRAAPVTVAVAPYPQPAARTLFSASRLMDLVIASTLCVALLPVLVFIATYLKMLERGPVFFAHRRIGQDGKSFDCLKFRTMRVDADKELARLLATDEKVRREWDSTQKLLCDPRVTRFGRVLRNASLDELPQLINVLRGEMAIVGPRPVIEEEMRRYGRYAAQYTSVRPGLTGLWQVTRNARTSYRRRVATDIYYVRNRSLAFDFRILLATIPAVLLGNG